LALAVAPKRVGPSNSSPVEARRPNRRNCRRDGMGLFNFGLAEVMSLVALDCLKRLQAGGPTVSANVNGNALG